MAEGLEGLTKKERLGMERDQAKLQASLGGIREMGGLPDLIFVIDVNKEDLAILEARKLGIPVVAVVDTNCSPDGVDYIIPGNDDAARAIALYCDLVSRAALDGMSAQLETAGVDLGRWKKAPSRKLAAGRPKSPAEAEVQAEAEAPADAEAEAPAAETETRPQAERGCAGSAGPRPARQRHRTDMRAGVSPCPTTTNQETPKWRLQPHR
jgi:small subunit ribosomal protein S2